MKKILIGVGASVIGLVVIISVVLEFLNWNQFKPQISEQVQKLTGRKLDIKGNLNFRLLPTPKLIAHEIEFANDKRAREPLMLSVKRLKVGVALLPLFSKKIKVSKIILDTPIVNIEKFSEGGNWIFKSSPDSSSSLEKNETTLKNSTEKSGDFALGVDRAEIIQGTVNYRNQENLTQLSDINMEMNMDSLEGPYTVKGAAKIKDEPYQLDLKTGALHQAAPASVDLTISQKLAQLSFKGKIDPFNKTANGEFKGQAHFQQTTEFKGNIQASEKEIKITEIFIESGPYKGTGDVFAKLEPALSIAANLSGLPGETALKLNAVPSGEGAQGKAVFHSKNFYQFLSAFGIEAAILKKQSQINYSSDFAYAPKGKREIELSNIVLNLNNSSLTGYLKAGEGKNGYSAFMDLKTSNLDALLALAGVKTKRPLGVAKVKGTMAGTPTHIQINQVYAILNGEIKIDGELSNPATNLGYNLDIKASHPNLSLLLEDASKPASAISIAALAKGTLNQIDLPQLTVSAGPLNLSGSALYGRGERSLIKANLKANKGNIMALLGGSHTISSSKTPQHLSASQSKAASQAAKGASRWSREPIDVSFLRTIDMDVRLSAPDCSTDKLMIKDLALSVQLNQGKFDFKQTARLAEGSLNTQISGKITDVIDAMVDLNLNNVSLQQLSIAAADYKDVEGKGSVQFSGKTQGKSQFELISALSGKGKIETRDTLLKGWDLKHISQSLKGMKGLSKSMNFENMMGKVKDKNTKQTKINMSSSLTAQEGVFNANDFKLAGDGVKAEGQGRLSLPAWTLEATANVILTDLDDKMSIPAYARGPLDNLSYGMRTDQLMQSIYQNYLSGAVEKALGLKKGDNPLSKILGLKSKDDQSPPPSSDTEAGKKEPLAKNDLEKVVGNVLGNLLRN